VFLTIVVDIHSHILPEVDDGSKSWDTSIAMCRMAADDGITHQVATPHANDRYHYDRPYLQSLVDHLQSLIGASPKLSLGCDFHLSYDNLQDLLANPARYAIASTHYMLVELSNYSIPQQIGDCFTQLGDRGITAIITHPERNPILRETPQRVVEWAEQGCVIQVTGSALTGFWVSACAVPRYGSSSTTPCTSWPRTRTIQRSECPCYRPRVTPRRKFAAKMWPTRW